MGIDDVMKKGEEKGIKFVHLLFADVNGYLRGRTVPFSVLKNILEEGIGFDGSSIPGFVEIYESDMVMKPDPETFTLLPQQKTAALLCDIYRPGNKRFEGDPRFVCQKSLEKANKLGFQFFVGAEVEFYTLKRDSSSKVVPVERINDGMYFDMSPGSNLTEEFRMSFSSHLLKNERFKIEAYHHEVGSGQHEINFRFSDPVATSDNIILYKLVAKEVARQHGFIATFMPKPFHGAAGNGMHIHLSLFNMENENLFFDERGYGSLSETAKYFIGGLLLHAKALSAIAAPTVNSYKRLVPGYEAPIYVAWSRRNRSALVRVPHYFPGRKKHARLEYRCPDPLSNPYLLFPAVLEAGLHGIREKIDPGEPLDKDLYHLNETEKNKLGIETLPGSLFEALKELRKDKIVVKALGSHVSNTFFKEKMKEWSEYREAVTPWEIEKYLMA